MIKKIGITLLLILTFVFTSVSATTFTNQLPGGKNYIDTNNLVIGENSLSTVNEFKVKENTFYTFSMPGYDMITGDLSIEIWGNDVYLGGLTEYNEDCIMELQETTCTFETAVGESYLNIVINSLDIENFIYYYGMNAFQLEEGNVYTYYEDYIPPLEDTTEPSFSGIGAYIKSYSNYESILSIINNHIVVIDEVDGDITSNIVIISDLYTGNEQKVGEYLVELSASDSSGNIAYFSLSILVKDEIDPIITGPTDIDISISEITNINEIITNYFTVSDGYGTVTTNILIDNYTVNKDLLGIYLVKLEAVDESLNSVSLEFNISLVDIDSPVVTSILNVDSYLSNPLDLTGVLDTIILTDNYDDMSNPNIIVISNQFNGNESIPGTYTINFDVSDGQGNTINEDIVVTVIDDVAPEISGPITYQGSYEEELLASDFLNMLNVSDNSDSLSLIDMYVIEDTYSNRSGITGSYLITFGVIDSNNNEITHSISITLFDDIAPIIYIDDYIVTVDMESTFTTDDALTLLINSNELTEGSYTVKKLFDGYSGNELNEGTYVYLLEFTNNSGESFQKEFLVKVIDTDDSLIDEDLVIRNIILYSFSIAFFGYVVYKNKK